MKLVIGLGNPDAKYARTRHNIGYRVLDFYASKHHASFAHKDKFKAEVAEISGFKDKILLMKPLTYYNLSGEAARAVADFYKVLPNDILIVHDELALPFGTVRTRLGGSDAGNNGVKSISQHIGMDTARIRLGIYDESREQMEDADFVLSRFSPSEEDGMEPIIQKTCQLIDDFIIGRFEHTTHK